MIETVLWSESDVRVVQSTMSSDASVADSSPVSVASFDVSLDSLLSWLNQADDAVSKQNPVANDIESLKEQFHHHEVNCFFYSSDVIFLCQPVIPRGL